MMNDPQYPVRKALRLKHYDYATPGDYFITICAAHKRCILSTITAVGEGLAPPAVHLTPIGSIIERHISGMPKRFPCAKVTTFVIMPNHIHLLLSLHGNVEGTSVADVIGALKSTCTRDARPYLPEGPLFQRGYYDHIIRNEKDYSETWAYIEANPSRWAEDSLFMPQ